MILKLKVKDLEKYAEIPNLLSTNEFISQARVLLTGSNRRKEHSYLLKIKPLDDKTTNKSVIQSVANIALDTLRVNYDLITKYGNEQLLIFLQNTNKEGTDVFIERLKENIKGEFLTIPVSFEATLVDTVEAIQKTN